MPWRECKMQNTKIKYKMHESQHNSFEKTVTTAAITIRTWCVHSKIERKQQKKTEKIETVAIAAAFTCIHSVDSQKRMMNEKNGKQLK